MAVIRPNSSVSCEVRALKTAETFQISFDVDLTRRINVVALEGFSISWSQDQTRGRLTKLGCQKPIAVINLSQNGQHAPPTTDQVVFHIEARESFNAQFDPEKGEVTDPSTSTEFEWLASDVRSAAARTYILVRADDLFSYPKASVRVGGLPNQQLSAALLPSPHSSSNANTNSGRGSKEVPIKIELDDDESPPSSSSSSSAAVSSSSAAVPDSEMSSGLEVPAVAAPPFRLRPLSGPNSSVPALSSVGTGALPANSSSSSSSSSSLSSSSSALSAPDINMGGGSASVHSPAAPGTTGKKRKAKEQLSGPASKKPKISDDPRLDFLRYQRPANYMPQLFPAPDSDFPFIPLETPRDPTFSESPLALQNQIHRLFHMVCVKINTNKNQVDREDLISQFADVCGIWVTSKLNRISNDYISEFKKKFKQFVAGIRAGEEGNLRGVLAKRSTSDTRDMNRYAKITAKVIELGIEPEAFRKCLDGFYVRCPKWKMSVQNLFKQMKSANIDKATFDGISESIRKSTRKADFVQVDIRFKNLPRNKQFTRLFTFEEFEAWKAAKASRSKFRFGNTI